MEFDIKNMNVFEAQKLLMKTASDVETKMVEAALHKANYEQLNDATKAVIAKNTPSTGTVLEREKAALVSEQVEAHRLALGNARHLYLVSQAKSKAMEVKFDAVRSVISLEKEKLARGI